MIAGTVRVAIALLPVALTPVLVNLIAGGQIDLGGGEMDLVWVLPWFLWSLLFAISSLMLWYRGWSLSGSVARSTIVGFAGLLLAAVVLAAFGQLGVAGRF